MKLFSINRCGDSFNKYGWDVKEYEKSYEDRFCIFRGDLSPIQGRDRAIRYLKRAYPGCKVKVEK